MLSKFIFLDLGIPEIQGNGTVDAGSVFFCNVKSSERLERLSHKWFLTSGDKELVVCSSYMFIMKHETRIHGGNLTCTGNGQTSFPHSFSSSNKLNSDTKK